MKNLSKKNPVNRKHKFLSRTSNKPPKPPRCNTRHSKFDPLLKRNLMKELEFNNQKGKMLNDLESGLKKLKQATPTKKERATKKLF